MRLRWLLIVAAVLLVANLAWLAWHGGLDGLRARTTVGEPVTPVPEASGTAALPADTMLPREGSPGVAAARRSPAASPDARIAPTSPLPPAPSGLIVPVQGVATADLRDTFGDARSGERMHEALDILAPAGTPVFAVADGRIEKLFTSDRGGLTVYQFEPSGTWCYYYAHLQAYAPGLAEGATVKRGDVIGFVGSTGNADPSAPHLHFAVFALTPEKQWWTGTPVNPYPLLGGSVSQSP